MGSLQFQWTREYPFTPMNGEVHYSRNVDTLFVLNIPTGCEQVLAQASGHNIRYTCNGTNPTASSGFVLLDGSDPITIPITKETTLKFIAETAGALLEYEFGL